MSKRELIKSELLNLYSEGTKLGAAFQKKKDDHFQQDYQAWYTKALPAVRLLAPDRLVEFRGYYEIDPKRKTLGYGTYVIQDFIKGVAPSKFTYPDFNTRTQVVQCFFNQLTIVNAIRGRADSLLGDLEAELYSEIQDNEITVARQLLKINLRAAGALMGVVIEGHLQKVAQNRNIKIAKKSPTIADLNDPLKAAEIIDTPTWRRLSYLADLRNLCAHKKEIEPTKEQVEELITGTQWAIKSIF